MCRPRPVGCPRPSASVRWSVRPYRMVGSDTQSLSGTASSSSWVDARHLYRGHQHYPGVRYRLDRHLRPARHHRWRAPGGSGRQTVGRSSSHRRRSRGPALGAHPTHARHRSRRVVRPSLRATTGVSGGWKDSTSWPSSTASTPTCVASKPGAHRHGTPGLGAAVVPATVTPSGAYVRAGASRRRFPNDHLRANGRRPLTRRRRVNGRNPQDCIGVRPPVLALIP